MFNVQNMFKYECQPGRGGRGQKGVISLTSHCSASSINPCPPRLCSWFAVAAERQALEPDSLGIKSASLSATSSALLLPKTWIWSVRERPEYYPFHRSTGQIRWVLAGKRPAVFRTEGLLFSLMVLTNGAAKMREEAWTQTRLRTLDHLSSG